MPLNAIGRSTQLGGSSAIKFSHQTEEEAESFAIDGGRVELETSGKQSASMLASSCLPLAFCRLSCAVSCLSRSVSFLICSVSFLVC
jgi:hypothetical protein